MFWNRGNHNLGTNHNTSNNVNVNQQNIGSIASHQNQPRLTVAGYEQPGCPSFPNTSTNTITNQQQHKKSTSLVNNSPQNNLKHIAKFEF